MRDISDLKIYIANKKMEPILMNSLVKLDKIQNSLKTHLSQVTPAMFGLVLAVVVAASTLSGVSAQSATNTTSTKAFQLAANPGIAIGGKIIIVGACPQGATSPDQCAFYNTVPVGPPPAP
jgi:hypothetical protein